MAKQRIDKEIARYALQGIEAAIEKLQRQAGELRKAIGGRMQTGADRAERQGAGVGSAAGADSRATGARNPLSADARRRISEAQKARWAKHRRDRDAAGGDGTASRGARKGGAAGRKGAKAAAPATADEQA